MNFLSMFDFFKVPLNFSFNSKEKVSSRFGVFVSFIIIVFLAVSFFKSDMVMKENPKIADYSVANDETIINLNNENFGFSFGLFTDFDYNDPIKFVDPRIFDIDVQLIYYFNSESKIKKLEYTNCTLDGNIKYDNYKKDLFCLSENQEINLNVTSLTSWNDNFSYIDVKFSKCSNKTSAIQCKSEEEINQYLNHKVIVFKFFENFFDYNDYKDPGKISYQNLKANQININFLTWQSYSLMQVDFLQNPDAYFDNDLRILKKYHQQDSSQTNSGFNISNPEEINDFYEFSLYPSLNKRIISRRYQTFIEALSQLGGLASFLKSIGSVFTSLFCHIKILNVLNKHLYRFKKEEPQNKNLNEINVESKIDNIHIINDSKNDNNRFIMSPKDIELENKVNLEKDFNTIPIRKKNSLDDEIQKKSKSSESIEWITIFSYFKFIFLKICRKKKNEKAELISKCEEFYKKDFDILNILKHLKDLELIKKIVFNKKQRGLFNLIKDQLNIFYFDKLENEKNNNNYLKFYEEENNTLEFTEIDKKLLKLMKKKK